MDFMLSAEQEMLREAARSFLRDKVPMPVVRSAMETDIGYEPDVWAQMADLGWQAMAIPEDHGGAGFTFFEVGILMEEMGRRLTPSPFLSTVVMAANLVLLAGSDEQRSSILGSISSGDIIATVAYLAAPGRPDVAATGGDAPVLNGVKGFVLDGHIADVILVEAAEEDRRSLYVVDAAQAAVSAEPLETLDMTRKQALVEFSGAAATRLGAPGSATAHLAAMEDLTAVALAFEQLGGAQECMEMAVQYGIDRYQFGRPIGSFQAVKHKCADMLVQVEGARSAAYHAGRAATTRDDADLSIAAAVARAHCSVAYFVCAAENIQIHGGIGFTWEHDAHLYFKRAKTDSLLLGDPVTWRARLADRLGL